MSLYLCPREGCGFGVAGEAPDDWDEPDPIIEHEDEHRREDERVGVPSPVRIVDMAGNVTILSAPTALLASIEATRVPRPATDPTNLAGLTIPRHLAPFQSFDAERKEYAAVKYGIVRDRLGRHVLAGVA